MFGWIIGYHSLAKLTSKTVTSSMAALGWRFLIGLFLLPLCDGQAPFPPVCPLNISGLQGSIVGTLLILDVPLGQPCLLTAAEPLSVVQWCLVCISNSLFLTGLWTLSPALPLNFHLIPYSNLSVLLNSAFPMHLVSPNRNLFVILDSSVWLSFPIQFDDQVLLIFTC